MTKRAFGDLERSILLVLQSGKKMTVQQVQKALGDKDKYTTIMTVMARLAEKKYLQRNRVGLRYEYWLANEQKNSRSLLDYFRSKLFGVKMVDMVSYLINDTEDLSQEDLEKIEQIITKAKMKRANNDG